MIAAKRYSIPFRFWSIFVVPLRLKDQNWKRESGFREGSIDRYQPDSFKRRSWLISQLSVKGYYVRGINFARGVYFVHTESTKPVFCSSLMKLESTALAGSKFLARGSRSSIALSMNSIPFILT